MLTAPVGAPEVANPAPVTVIFGTETAPIVVCGFANANVKTEEELVPAIVEAKPMAVPGCAVNRIPVESV